MQKSREIKIVLSSLVVLFMLSSASVYMFLNRPKEQAILGVQDNVAEENHDAKSEGVPYILSQAPILIAVGEMYQYIPRLVDLDNEESELVLELVDAPDWLYVTNNTVQGVPNVVGTVSFTLRVSDGYNSSQEKSYIIVEERNEQENI